MIVGFGKNGVSEKIRMINYNSVNELRLLSELKVGPQQFAPQFAPGATLLYLGDTKEKDMHVDSEKLEAIGFPMDMHSRISDVVLLDQREHFDGKDWIFLIEATDSVGPMSLSRVKELKDAYTGDAGLVFVTAFRTFSIYAKFAAELAWDTEVWIADKPTHMIHLNGDRFMGPRYDG